MNKIIIYVIFFYTIVPRIQSAFYKWHCRFNCHSLKTVFGSDVPPQKENNVEICLFFETKPIRIIPNLSKSNTRNLFKLFECASHTDTHTTGRTEDLCHAMKSALYPIINNIRYLILDTNSDDPINQALIMETAFTFILLYVKSSISIRNRSHGIDKFIAPIWMNQISDKMHPHLGTHKFSESVYKLFETPFVHFIAELFYYFNSYDKYVLYCIVFYPKCLMILNFSNGDQYLKRILYYYYYCRIVNSSPAYFIFFFF